MAKDQPAREPIVARGLEGVIVTEHSLSFIDGENGILEYKGYPIQDLATQASYEEVVYLLWYGHLPTQADLAGFSEELARHRSLPEEIMALLRACPPEAPAMSALRTAVSRLGLLDPDAEDGSKEANLRKAIRLVSQFSSIAAAFHRLRRGMEPIEPRQDLGHAANFLYMLHGEESPPEHVKALNAYYVLTADHGMNASTFTARVIASTNSDLHSAVTGAIGALKGPAHGGAPNRVMEMFQEIGGAENARGWLQAELDAGRRIMGLGHRVYKTLDPRATVLHGLTRELSTLSDEPQWLSIAEATEDAAVALLQEKKPQHRIYTNVEFYTATTLYYVGIPSDYYATMFACSRIAGWTAHLMEQYADNRLIRPRARYIGPRSQTFQPLSERG